MKKSVIIAIIIVVLAIGAGVYFLTKSSSKSKNTSETSTSTTSPDTNGSGTPIQSSDESQSITIVTYTDQGFSPNNVTIKSGESVKFTNASSRSLQMGSNPHPQHTDNTELNVGVISKGGSIAVKLTDMGTWKYHNHLRSGDSGTVIVQ